MKRILLMFISLVAIFVTSRASAQEYKMQGYWRQQWIVDKGDTIPHIYIKPVFVFDRGLDERKFWLLVKSVKKVYPIAQTAEKLMDDMEDQLLALPDDRSRKALVKSVYKSLIKEYTPVLEHMTRTQGRVLLKLINRQTSDTAYSIITEFKGAFLAGFWQGVSRIFGQNLKSQYGDAEEDKIIEQIIQYYEAGLL